jgi:hypothetical protein
MLLLLHESLLVDKRMGAEVRVVMPPWCGCCCNRAQLLLLLLSSSFSLCSLELEVLWLVLGPNPRF